jgi:hypothetical protein
MWLFSLLFSINVVFGSPVYKHLHVALWDKYKVGSNPSSEEIKTSLLTEFSESTAKGVSFTCWWGVTGKNGYGKTDNTPCVSISDQMKTALHMVTTCQIIFAFHACGTYKMFREYHVAFFLSAFIRWE